MKIGMVWSLLPPPAIDTAYIGTHHLHEVVGCDYLFWHNGDQVPDIAGEYDVLIVNLFEDMTHVESIKARFPNVYVIALPDSYFDEVFLQRGRESEQRYLRQLRAADMIGYVSESNRQFYSAWGKPMVKIPMPIGTDEYFAKARELPKQDYILTVDHSPRVVDYTIQNVLTVVRIQRETGLKVIYVKPGEFTPMYAEEFGLKAEFVEWLPYEDLVKVAAQARLGVDMYARYGFGRNELTMAYAGTPYISGNWTEGVYTPEFSPFAIETAVDLWTTYLSNKGEYESAQFRGVLTVSHVHSADAVRKQWERVQHEIMHPLVKVST